MIEAITSFQLLIWHTMIAKQSLLFSQTTEYHSIDKNKNVVLT